MEQYEVAIVYHPDLDLDLEKGAQKVKKILEDNNAKIVSDDVWGKRKLAYPVKGQEQGVYAFYTVEMAGSSITKIESTLGITEEVIRFLVTKLDHAAIAKAKEAKAQRKKPEAESKDEAKEEKDPKEDEKS